MTPMQKANEIMDRTGLAGHRVLKAISLAVEEAIREEREACAKVADRIEDSMAEAIAEAIRKRGQP